MGIRTWHRNIFRRANRTFVRTESLSTFIIDPKLNPVPTLDNSVLISQSEPNGLSQIHLPILDLTTVRHGSFSSESPLGDSPPSGHSIYPTRRLTPAMPSPRLSPHSSPFSSPRSSPLSSPSSSPPSSPMTPLPLQSSFSSPSPFSSPKLSSPLSQSPAPSPLPSPTSSSPILLLQSPTPNAFPNFDW